MSESSDTLLTATVHGVKNQLGELLWRLEARGDCQVEQSITLRCAQRLSSALLLGRDASAGLALSLDATDADALLEDIASEYRSLFPQLQVDCEAPGSAASREPRMVFVDRPLVTLVLGDVVHNACRAARSRVVLSASAWGQGVCFEVRDDGAGYPHEVLRASGGVLQSRGGVSSGLGLQLAASVAKAHRRGQQIGEIHLSNAPGACFRMQLP